MRFLPRPTNSPRHWIFWNVILFVAIAGVDYLLKRWASELTEVKRLGFFVFFPFSNRGVVAGLLAEVDPWIVRIFFSVLFGFLCLGGALLANLLRHKNTPLLKWGMIVYLSGVLGNAADRITRGAVVDYILVDLPGTRGVAFNFADLAVVTGFGLIATSIIKEREAIWYSGNTRQGYWIEGRFQRGFGMLLTLAGFAHFLVIAIYSYTFLRVFIGGGRVLTDIDGEKIIDEFLFGLVFLEATALVLTFAVSVIFSHRLVGPIVALEQFVIRKYAGLPAKFRLRKGDYFPDRLTSIATRVDAKFENQKPRE